METKQNIYQKLLEVQKEIGAIEKDSENPFFKSKYFDINKIIQVVNPLLSKNNLVLLQPIKDGKQYSIIVDSETTESVESELALPTISDPQKLGSAVTYYRRYTLQSLLGLQAEDDDANASSKEVNKPKSKPKATNENIKAVKTAMDKADNKKVVFEKASNYYSLTKEQLDELEMYSDL